MKEIDLTKKLSLLTTIEDQYITKLFNKIPWIVCDGLATELSVTDKPVLTVSFGFGNLVILVENDQIKYKFIPSKEFEKQLVDTVCNGVNLLELTLEKNLANKLTNIYKDLF